MFDTTLVAFAYGFIAVAVVVLAVAVATIAVALRDLRGSSATPVLVTASGPSERAFSRAA